jgi:kinesin family protein 3/17
VEGAKIYKVESPKEMQKLMNKGKENRKTGETLMNAGSSRSHSIFQIRVENSEEIDGEVKYKIGKLNLVDLAGSERPEKTGATGARLKEGININLSLTTLGNVISALVTKEAGGFIPYRESKLTMLLSDSLGGNTKTVMIANIGPADYNYDESLVTLWYAARAKKIKNKPKINEDPKDALLRSYQEEIEQIKKQLEQLNKGNVPLRQIKDKDGKIIQVEDEAAVKKLDEQLEKEKEEFKKKKEEEIKVIKEQKDMEEKEKDRLLKIIEKEKDDFKKNKEEAKNLFNKYKEMQSKVLNSKETHMKVKKQEEEISRTKEELRAIKMEEERLKRDLEEKSKTKLEFAKKYEDVQSKIDDINEKIQMIRDEIDNKKNENKENIEKIQNDIIELSEINKELTRENLKKEFIIKNFIPENEKVRISECLEFNEREGIYFVNKKKAIKKIYLCNEEILSKMKNNQNVEGGFMKYDFDKGDCDSMVNLNFELPDKLVSDFLGEPNEHFNKEVENILKDDDSDLLYYDKDLNLFDSNIIPMSETGLKDLLKAASQQQPVIKKKK